MTDDESAPAPRMRPELTALVNWLRSSGRMADVDYGRLLHEIVAIGWRAAIKASGQGDVDTLTSAARTVQTHLGATVLDHDAAALAFLLEGLIPLARFVGDNPVRLLVAIGVLTHEEIGGWVEYAARRNPPPLPPKRSWGS
jgi:hypothetical protein